MPPSGHCRVCGAPSPGTMPCRRCCGLLLERDNEDLNYERRREAALELVAIVAKTNGST